MVGRVRYQHDEDAPVIELKVIGDLASYRLEDEVAQGELEPGQRREPFGRVSTLRGIHNRLIERVNTSMGGWCETCDPDGAVLYRHPGVQAIKDLSLSRRGAAKRKRS